MQTVEQIFEKQNPQDGTIPEWAKKLAETYAKQKWEQACQMQINNCLDNLRPTSSDSLAYGDVASAPKPVFVP